LKQNNDKKSKQQATTSMVLDPIAATTDRPAANAAPAKKKGFHKGGNKNK